MSEWNDGRLDDLSDRVDRIEKKMDAGFARMDAKFDAVGERFDRLHHLMIQMAWTYGIGMLAFGAALLGLIAVKF
jgi:hypothetical protein